jgi:Lon protease-like protein
MSELGFEIPDGSATEIELPARMPVLPLKDTVVFPQTVAPLAIGQERSIKLIDDVVAGDRLLVLIAARDASIDGPDWDDIYDVGTLAVVHKMVKFPDGTLQVLIGGLQRVRVRERLESQPYLVAEVEALPDEDADALLAHHRARPLPSRGAAARSDERRRSEHPRAPRRLDTANDPNRGAATHSRDPRPRAASAPHLGNPLPRGRGARARLEDPVAGAVRDG